MSDRFPIHFFNVSKLSWQGASAVRDWDDAGMTVAMSPSYTPGKDDKQQMLDLLDEAGRRGIKVIMYYTTIEFRTAIKDGMDSYREKFTQAAADFGHHPAMLGFMVGDEPDAHEFEAFCNAFRIQQEIAPHLMPYGNLLPYFSSTEGRVGYTDWGAYIDDYVKRSGTRLISYDCYTQLNIKNDGLEQYFTNIKTYSEAAARNHLPWWTYLLCTGHYKYRCATEDDLRWQLGTATAHGANGISWFIFQNPPMYDDFRASPIDEHCERTETFGWISRVNKIFLKGHGAQLNRLKFVKARHLIASYGGFPLIAEDELIRRASSSNKTPLIASDFTDGEGGRYLAVVNNSQTMPTQAELRLKLKNAALYTAPWNKSGFEPLPFDKKVELSSYGEDFAAVRVWLQPGEMELYKITESK